MLPNTIQEKYIIGKKSVVGDPRRTYEDRAYVGEIERKNGTKLLTAIVADGVGSADFGARGAQLAIDTVVTLISKSRSDNIPLLLKKVIERANKAVYDENASKDGDGLSTLTIAIIHKDRCYVGNVGDSRAYWVRGEKLLQLTRDHTYYNIYGGDPHAENADIVVNAIGKDQEIKVDLGIYLKGDDQSKANNLGAKGVPLKPGDSILVCSDGLIKVDRRTNERYAKDSEIVEALNSELGPNKSAIKMVSTAEGRSPDDNVSAVTIQYISEEVMAAQKKRALVKKAKPFGIGAGILASLIFLGLFISFIKPPPPPAPEPQATFTPYPDLPDGVAYVSSLEGDLDGHIITSNETQDLVNGNNEFSQGSKIEIVHGVAFIGLQGSELYVPAGTSFSFKRTEGETVLFLERGAMIVKLSYGKVSIEEHGGVVAQVVGSIMGFSLSDGNPFVDCFEGHCELTQGVMNTVKLEGEHQYLVVRDGALYPTEVDERCKFWNATLGADVVPIGILECAVQPATATPEPTKMPKPSNPDDSTGGGNHPSK